MAYNVYCLIMIPSECKQTYIFGTKLIFLKSADQRSGNDSSIKYNVSKVYKTFGKRKHST